MTGDLVSDEHLAEWDALAEAATEGPWGVVLGDQVVAQPFNVTRGSASYKSCICRLDELDYEEAEEDYDDEDEPPSLTADAQFIAAARTAVPLLVRALRDARAENERLTHLGGLHHADSSEWRAERDTWRDRALQAEADRDGWRKEAITRRRTLINVARGLHLKAGRIQMELNEACAADHDHKLLADEWWRKCQAAERCLAELAKSAACLNTIEGVLGARLVCIRPSGHTGEHASVAGARWSLASTGDEETTHGS